MYVVGVVMVESGFVCVAAEMGWWNMNMPE